MAICLDHWDKERDRYTDVHSKNIDNNSSKKKETTGVQTQNPVELPD